MPYINYMWLTAEFVALETNMSVSQSGTQSAKDRDMFFVVKKRLRNLKYSDAEPFVELFRSLIAIVSPNFLRMVFDSWFNNIICRLGMSDCSHSLTSTMQCVYNVNW
jgi:hypothetical protein